jgi:hypothetical protein
MAKAMGSERRLKAFMDVVLSEMRANPAFAERVGAVLDPPSGEPAELQTKASRPRVSRPLAVEGATKRGNRRAASLVDPLTAIQSGEQQVRNELAPLDLEQLRDVMADYRMDPSKLAMKWKDRERVIDHIVATAIERAQKGDAFRA